MQLLPHETQAAVWLKLKARTEERLAMLRSRNDGNLTFEETLKLRGRIAELKEFLALENPAPEQVADD